MKEEVSEKRRVRMRGEAGDRGGTTHLTCDLNNSPPAIRRTRES